MPTDHKRTYESGIWLVTIRDTSKWPQWSLLATSRWVWASEPNLRLYGGRNAPSCWWIASLMQAYATNTKNIQCQINQFKLQYPSLLYNSRNVIQCLGIISVKTRKVKSAAEGLTKTLAEVTWRHELRWWFEYNIKMRMRIWSLCEGDEGLSDDLLRKLLDREATVSPP